MRCSGSLSPGSIARCAMVEDLSHHGAATTAASLEILCDPCECAQRDELPPQRFVDRALDHPRSDDRGQVAERPCDRGDRERRPTTARRDRVRTRCSRGRHAPSRRARSEPGTVISTPSRVESLELRRVPPRRGTTRASPGRGQARRHAAPEASSPGAPPTRYTPRRTGSSLPDRTSRSSWPGARHASVPGSC